MSFQPEGKVVGLVTIRPNDQITSLRKNIWKYYGGSIFMRDGSISMPKVFDIEIKDVNSDIVKTIDLSGIKINFVPASLYCYTVGKNLVTSKKKKLIIE